MKIEFIKRKKICKFKQIKNGRTFIKSEYIPSYNNDCTRTKDNAKIIGSNNVNRKKY